MSISTIRNSLIESLETAIEQLSLEEDTSVDLKPYFSFLSMLRSSVPQEEQVEEGLTTFTYQGDLLSKITTPSKTIDFSYTGETLTSISKTLN